MLLYRTAHGPWGVGARLAVQGAKSPGPHINLVGMKALLGPTPIVMATAREACTRCTSPTLQLPGCSKKTNLWLWRLYHMCLACSPRCQGCGAEQSQQRNTQGTPRFVHNQYAGLCWGDPQQPLPLATIRSMQATATQLPGEGVRCSARNPGCRCHRLHNGTRGLRAAREDRCPASPVSPSQHSLGAQPPHPRTPGLPVPSLHLETHSTVVNPGLHLVTRSTVVKQLLYCG